MNEMNRDIFYLALAYTPCCLTNFWSMMFIYQASYSHLLNDSLSISQVYLCSMLVQFGRLLGSFVGPLYFDYLGFKGATYGFSLLFFIFYILQIYSGSLIPLYMAYIIYGIILFLKTSANSMFISEKYKGKLSQVKYINILLVLAGMIWSILI